MSTPAYREILARSRRFLDRAIPGLEIGIITADSTTTAADAVRESPLDAALSLVLIDADGSGLNTDPFDSSLPEALDQLADGLPEALRATFSAHSTYVYGITATAESLAAAQVARPFTLRALPADAWVLAADVICAFTDHVQLRHTGSALRAATKKGPSALAAALHDFLGRQPRDTADGPWGLHYYTGSVVSGTIADLDRLAAATGNPVLRGPSEHSLASGALARWQLDRAPFVIVVTSGMVDEFRGTLANLRDARARGFIVCADTPPEAWFPFQGTVHAAEDSRAVLAAKGIPYVHLDDPERIAEGLADAYAQYHAHRGPVFLLATPAVLDATGTAGELNRPGTVEPPPTAALQVEESDLAPVLRMVNSEPCRLLWQCGTLDAEESWLVHDIASRAGVGLADSLTRPGSVRRHRDDTVVEEYLGTLGLYAFSARVHAYLHADGRLRPRGEQALFFLKSRIGEAATPFSPRTLSRQLRIVQVSHEAAHLAPYSDHPVHAEARAFLKAVRERLDVTPEVLAVRREAIARTRDSASDVIHELPVLPMSANYFFQHLRTVLEDLITRHGYTYTGVFDVGRGGLSAVRNLPRTGPGFSGWYGRALMGDALQAVPAVALTRDDNVLAFIGDGAASLVPDITPTLVQQAALYGRRLRQNVTVFRLVDGGHSVIRTYHEGRTGAESSRQTQVLSLLEPEWTRRYGELTVRHQHITDAAETDLRGLLQQRATVTFASVLLAHNNEGDGLSLLSSLGWQRDELPELTFAMARAAR
ncbi:hypothetical protein ACQB60_32170 [Actinomycetota bacterium Odt1-20B]